MSSPSPNRVAIVTGASGGIGRAVAERLARDGMTVVVHYSGNRAKAEEVVDAVRAAGSTATAVRADVGDEAEVASLFDETERAHGGIDVVVNTAGIMLLAPLAEMPLDDIDRMHPRFGIGTTIVVPGSFPSGTNHFASAGSPEDTAVAEAYEVRYAGLVDQVGARLAELAPEDADPAEVARQIAAVVDLPAHQRPFRVHIDPVRDGAEQVNDLGDRVRAEFYARIGLADLLTPVRDG